MWVSAALKSCRSGRKEGCPSGISSYSGCKSTNPPSLILLCPRVHRVQAGEQQHGRRGGWRSRCWGPGAPSVPPDGTS